jgi:Domain of unknown function (DUF5076)
MYVIRELMLPPDTKTAEQAVELLRGWIIDGQPQYALLPSVWNNDLESWGRFLADTARHISNAIAEDTNRNAVEILEGIMLAISREIVNPTGKHEGTFHERS